MATTVPWLGLFVHYNIEEYVIWHFFWVLDAS